METRNVDTTHGSLAVRISAGHEPTIVCLHGFTMGGAMFDELAQLLPHRTCAPDLPGHGATTVAPVDLQTTVAALAESLDVIAPVVLVGYSQGGRIARHLAARHPHLVSRLALVSTNPGLAPEERAARAVADKALAKRIVNLGLHGFLDEWLAQPLVAVSGIGEERRRTDRAIRERNTAEGLATALRGLGQGVVPPVASQDLLMPTLWIAGAADAVYCDLARRNARPGMAQIIPDAGHNLVLETPASLAAIVTWFAGL